MKYLLLPLLGLLYAGSYAQGPFVLSRYDLVPGIGSSSPHDLFVSNGQLYFNADSPSRGRELWKFDGITKPGIVKDINTGTGSSFPQSYVTLGSKVYFAATTDSFGMELWVTDGTDAGTEMVKDIWPGKSSSKVSPQIFAFNGTLYFMADDTVKNRHPWISDGTPSGTKMLKKISNSTYSYYSPGFVAYKNKVFFTGNAGTSGFELWVTDGTEAGTELVTDLLPGVKGVVGPKWVHFNELYFGGGIAGSSRELCKTDGTAAGCQLIKEIYPGAEAGFISEELVESNGKLYFIGNDGIHGWELWVTDGTAQGTKMIKDTWPGVNIGGGQWGLTAYKNKIYFGDNKGQERQLWVSDGTEKGTVIYNQLFPGIIFTDPVGFIVYKDYLYFIARPFMTTSYRLMRLDGNGTAEIVAPDLPICWYTYSYKHLYIFDSTLYFSASDSAGGCELWSLKDTGIHAPIHINELSTAGISFSIFPNPCNGNFKISLADADFLDAAITVYDMTGKKMYEQALIKGNTTYEIHVPQLPTGLYMVQLNQDDAIVMRKLSVY